MVDVEEEMENNFKKHRTNYFDRIEKLYVNVEISNNFSNSNRKKKYVVLLDYQRK